MTKAALTNAAVSSPLLAVRPHLAAHVVSMTEVALIGERERYAVRGELYAALVPLLDGSRNADQIVAALAAQYPPEHIYYALYQLEAKGYIAPAADRSIDALAASWWGAHAIDASGATDAINRRAVIVLDAGAHPKALARLRDSLGADYALAEQTGAASLALVATADYLDPRFADKISELTSLVPAILPTRIGGGEFWLGPLVVDGQTDRFTIMLRRLADNRPVEVAALKRGARFPLIPAQGVRQTFDLAAAWISSALLSIIGGDDAAGLRECVVALDPWTLEGRRHPIAIAGQPVPREIPAIDGERAPIELTASPKRFTLDGGHRTCAPDETLVRLEAFVSPITGIIPRLEKLPALDGMYVWAATQTVGGSSGRVPFQSNRALGQPNAAAGKGASDTQAKVSCLAEAVERYSCSYFGDEPRQRARLAELGQRGLHPSDLLQFSASQYARRDLTKSSRSLFTFVPMPFDPDRAIEWTPAWSLTRQRTVWLPTAFCYFGYRNPPDHDFCRADSNGCASGNTLEEAILQALMELVERDACAIWWYNRLVLRGIDLASFGDPFFDRIAETLARSGRNLDVLDLTNDLGITAAMAVSWERATGARIHLGLGCHLDPRIAVSRAVSELSQSLAFEYSPESERQVAFFDDHARWLDTQQIEDHPYLRACAGKLRGAAEFPDLSARDVRDDVIRCVELLEGKGLETIVLEHTRPDIGFPVARVAVPGLRHFWPRFAPGRLYDIPPLLGWRETASVEAELNSIGLFF